MHRVASVPSCPLSTPISRDWYFWPEECLKFYKFRLWVRKENFYLNATSGSVRSLSDRDVRGLKGQLHGGAFAAAAEGGRAGGRSVFSLVPVVAVGVGARGSARCGGSSAGLRRCLRGTWSRGSGLAAVTCQGGPTSLLRRVSGLVRLLEHGGSRRWLWRCVCGRWSCWGCGSLPRRAHAPPPGRCPLGPGGEHGRRSLPGPAGPGTPHCPRLPTPTHCSHTPRRDHVTRD